MFQALVRLNKLGVTMSPKSINKALDLLGEDFDLPIKSWKGDITAHLEKCSELVQEGCDLETTKEELVQLAAAGANVAEQITAANVSQSSINVEKKKLFENRPSSFNLVLDNVDLKVLASNMTSDDQNKDFHWCNHNAYLDRVNPTHLADDSPIADLEDVPNSTFLPSFNDQNLLLSDFTVLVGRVLVENFSAFEIFKDVIPLHIKHKYSDEMKNKTETVRLLLLQM